MRVPHGAYWWVTAAAIGTIACSQAAQEQRNTGQQSEERKTRMSEECVGRFRMSVPENVVVTSRSQSIYGVEVRTEPLRSMTAAKQWEQRLEALEKVPALPGKKSAIRSRLSLDSGVEAVWYDDGPNLLMLEALKPFGDHTLWVSTDADAGKEPVAEKLSRAVVAAYAPETGYGFCLGFGSVRMGPSLSETARINFEHSGASGAKIEFASQTVRDPDTKTYMNLDEERDFAKASGGTLIVLLERERTVENLPGKEMRISMTIPGEVPMVRYTWHFAGVPRDGTKPKINLVGRAAASGQAQLAAAWDALLNSIKSVPVGAPR